MRTLRLCSLIVLAALALPFLRSEGPKQVPPEKIDKLIQQLGSEEFAERQQATKDLEAIGEPALHALRRAGTSSDLEVRNRAQGLVERIETDLTTRAMLKPTKVRLNVEDVSVADAVKQLAEQSGYRITITGDHAKLKDKITLDTGDTSFWEALDSLCAVEQLKNGDVQVELTLINVPVEEQRPDPPLPPNIVIVKPLVDHERRAKCDMPRLVDEQGRAYELVAVPTQKEGKDAEVLTLVFRRQEGQGEPARLVVDGRRWVTFDVPFTMKNVPLR